MLNITVNINADSLLSLLKRRGKKKGMTLFQYYKECRKKYPEMDRRVFHEFLDDQITEGKLKTYMGKRTTYVVFTESVEGI